MSPFDINPENDAGHAIDQDDIIAFHLHELTPPQERAFHRALHTNPALQAESLAVAATLNALPKHEPLPSSLNAATTTNRIWNSLRPSLIPYVPVAATPFAFLKLPVARWAIPTLATSTLVAITALVLALHHDQPAPLTTIATNHPSSLSAPTSTTRATIPSTTFSPSAPSAEITPSLAITLPSNHQSALLNPTAQQPSTAPTTPQVPTTASPQISSSISSNTATPESSSNQPFSPAPAQTQTSFHINRLGGPRIHSRSASDLTLAMFGNFPVSTSTSGTGASAITQTFSQSGTNAVGALASFHQQFRPWLGYRITTTYSRPTFFATSGTSSSTGNFSTGGFALAQRIYELSATYNVQGPRHHRLSTSVEAGGSLLAFSSTNPYSTTSATVHSFHGAAVVGVASELAFNKHWALRAEYRALLYKPPAFYDTVSVPASGNLTLSNNPILGITYHFGSTGID
jgi:hypothetical protein